MTGRRAPRAFDVPSDPATDRPSDATSRAPSGQDAPGADRRETTGRADPSSSRPAAAAELEGSPRPSAPLQRDPPRTPRTPRALTIEAVTIEDDALVAAEPSGPPVPVARRRGPWAALAATCATGLIGLAVGLWVERVVAELFAVGAWAGLLGLTLALGLALATFAVVLREAVALMRLGRRDALRERARVAISTRDAAAARGVATDLAAMFADRAVTARGRERVAEAADAIMDADDRIAHAEVALLEPLDAEARALVLAAARRVSVVTAVAPRALIDVAYVLIENVRLVRAIAAVYGLRPGRIGMARLLRDVIGHLAVTGAVSAGDGLIEQAVGHGVASRVSARLGEGVLNGLLTTRMGLSAIDLCRPLPHLALRRPTARDLLAELTTGPARIPKR